MPFVSKAQVRKCFAMKARGEAKGWNCEEWADKTKSIKKLPEKVKTSEFYCNIMLDSFTKVAKKLFDPRKSPVIPKEKIESKMTAQSVQDTVFKRIKNVDRVRPAKRRSDVLT